MSRREVGKLVMSQFRSRTRVGRRKSLLQEAEKILRSGAVEQPAWFPGLKAVAPSAYVSAMKPQQIVYPEDKLIRAYYNRHPTARFLPIDLDDPNPHFVRAFALRQLKVMRAQRVPEDVALRVVEMEATEEERAATEAERLGKPFTRRLTPKHTLATGRIEQVQEEEELAWAETKRERFEQMEAKRAEAEEERAAVAAAEEKAREEGSGAGGDAEDEVGGDAAEGDEDEKKGKRPSSKAPASPRRGDVAPR